MKRRVSVGIFWKAKVTILSAVFACWGGGEAVAQAQDLTPPSAEPDFFIVEEFLEAQGVPALVLPEDGPTQQQRNRQERAWEERVLASVLRKRVAGQPIEAEANAFLDQWLTYRYGGVRDAEQTEATIRNARALIHQRRLDDAYFYYCFTEIVKEELDNRRQRANLLSQSLLDYPQQGYPPILAVWISSRLLLIPAYDREKAQPAVIKRPALARTATDSFVHTISGGEVYQPDESWLMVQHFRRLLGGFPGDLVHLTEAIWSLPSMEPWMVELFQGLFELRLAWKSRGSEWASRVTEKGMEGWLLHLEKAYEHLLASWQANPDDPSAAAEMINVVVGGYSRDGDTARRWFDRSVAAQADYDRAYDIMWWAYRPRWGTSREKRMAFGLACWLSQRFDTTIPMELETALEDIVYVRREKWREALCQEPLVIGSRNGPQSDRSQVVRLIGASVSRW